MATGLSPYQLDSARGVLVQHWVITQHVSTRRQQDLSAPILPEQPWGEPLATQGAVDRVMTALLTVVSKGGQRVVELADQQILTRIFHKKGQTTSKSLIE